MSTLDVVAREWGWVRSESNPQTLPDRSRKDLAKLFNRLNFKVGAEVGVEQGVFSKQLCAYCPGLKLYAIDSWRCYGLYEQHSTQASMDSNFEKTKVRLAPYDACVIREDSVRAAASIPDGSLDFVYIDASHLLAPVIADIAAWEPKVRSGGIVAGHDFTFDRFSTRRPLVSEAIHPGPKVRPCHVIDAVTAWTRCHQIDPWFVLDGKRGVASWMWVKGGETNG
jgi:hypothetical protein